MRKLRFQIGYITPLLLIVSLFTEVVKNWFNTEVFVVLIKLTKIFFSSLVSS